MLAAASEAAWFTVRAHVPTDEKLARLVAAGENAAEVIDRTSRGIAQRGALPTRELSDVRAQAGRLRELRNYGLHPIRDVESEHEEAFTEAGAALHFLGARSYLLRLRKALHALQSETIGAA